ncbi:hypothetical protein ACIRD2_06805 [Streptomyces sp. NPDC093595]|uniref:hypothetical protein n=1 Tax=Streptomyces sp. NPDC093595 TaxID=3366045 RepID=UPI00382EF15F
MRGPTCQPRGSRALSACCLLALALGGCHSGQAPGARPSGASSPAAAAAAPQPGGSSAGGGEPTGTVSAETVSAAPKPLNGGTPLAALHSRAGGATVPLGAIGTGRLGVQIVCRGEGTLSAVVEPVGLAFSLECAGRGSSPYNEVRLQRATAEGRVRVTAPSAVRWALTAER